MNQNLNPENHSGHEAEETLRLVAQLPPPADLTERVHHRLEVQRLDNARLTSPRRGFWSLWMPAQRLQYAGAALLVLAIAGSAWTVRHAGSGGASGSSNGQPPVQPIARPLVPSASQGAGFGPASSEARPSNLNPIKVPPAPKKKPSASRPLKRTPKPSVAQSADSDLKAPANP
jgi:hypothetical protein